MTVECRTPKHIINDLAIGESRLSLFINFYLEFRLDDWHGMMCLTMKLSRCNWLSTPGVSCASMKVQTHSCLMMMELECVSWMKVCDAFNAFRIGTPVNSAKSKVSWVVWFSKAS
jgi:hypothetical protein